MRANQTQTLAASSFPDQMTFRPVAVTNVRPPQAYEKPSVNVDTNGRTNMNLAASMMMNDLAHSYKLAPKEYVLVLAAGDEGYFAMKPAPLGTPAAAKVTTYKSGKISLQIHELFGEAPDLRPIVRQRCVPFITKNQDGETVMVVGVKIGQDNPVHPRTSSKHPTN